MHCLVICNTIVCACVCCVCLGGGGGGDGERRRSSVGMFMVLMTLVPCLLAPSLSAVTV